MKDIVFPRNNESEFISLARKLGYDELVFVYEDDNDFYKKPAKVKITNVLICHPKKVEKCRQKSELVLVQSSENDRFVLEKTKAYMLFGVEATTERDPTHQRASGLNHILCKIAEKTKKNLAFDFNMLLKAKNKSLLLGRMKQNIKLCRKYKVKMCIASFAKQPLEMRSPNDLQSFFILLGMHASEAKKAID